MRRKKNTSKKKNSKFSKLSLFQKPGIKFFKPCPLSGKDAPVIDYKNIKLLKRYLSESGRILPSMVGSRRPGESGWRTTVELISIRTTWKSSGNALRNSSFHFRTQIFKNTLLPLQKNVCLCTSVC